MTGLVTSEERRRTLLLEHCDNCAAMVADGKTIEQAEAAHEVCHGWTHCECCGGCPACEAESGVEIALEEWEQSLTATP